MLQLAAQDQAAVCGQVWVEFIGGFRDDRRRAQSAAKMADYLWLDTDRAIYELAAEWQALHPKLGAGDAIIAATAHAHGAALLTLDAGFHPLASAGLELVSSP